MSRKRMRVLTACHEHYSLASAEDKNAQLDQRVSSCHFCRRASTRVYFAKKRGANAKQLEFALNMPQFRIRQTPEAREVKLKKQREYKSNLAPGYVRSMIMQNTDLKSSDIPDDVVGAWAELIKFKRLLREMKKK